VKTSVVLCETVLCEAVVVRVKEVLECTVSEDIQYVSANPTFHHWKTGNRRYGLAFQSSADGRSFERSVRLAAYEMQKQCMWFVVIMS